MYSHIPYMKMLSVHLINVYFLFFIIDLSINFLGDDVVDEDDFIGQLQHVADNRSKR